ncbi:response regulator transcription factor [Acanthopleuribacter pedis]|uniref:Response regulator transcription factor n=1 Tax=Acanthopleuribacter pedis TaxID=442870 RepID=A0A8J7QEG4_9BACT|nr:response regulator transcription factor [Acanthopleuribacter pedis]MBO1323112.1 response regulator transcription factor [Acanthopleuribacter pedis]
MKLLLVEDSQRLRNALKKGLEKEGFAVDAIGDGAEGLEWALAYDYDVLVLDLMLPGMNGLDLLARLRNAARQTHVLILSAKDQVQDRIRGLELGADDYLIKPIDFNELVARLKALVRRRYAAKSPITTIGAVKVNTALNQVWCNDREVALSPKEFALLQFLLAKRGRVMSRDLIRDHLYEGYGDVTGNVIDVVVCKIRKKVRVAGQADLIQTKRGFGYVIP